MRERDRWSVSHRPHDLFEEALQIVVELREILHIGFERILKRALRSTLSAPVECRNRITTRVQLADDFAVFLDELGLSVQQHADTARLGLRAEPAAAQAHTVARREEPRFERNQPRAFCRIGPSFIARPMSPATRSLPCMNAEVPSSSPLTIFSKSARLTESVQSALLPSPSVTELGCDLPSIKTEPSAPKSNLSVPPSPELSPIAGRIWSMIC